MDTTDRRLRENRPQQPLDPAQADYANDRYHRLKKAGICVMCEVQAVSDRAYCHKCSSSQVTCTARWGSRKLLAAANVANLEKAITDLECGRPVPGLLTFLRDLVKR